MANISKIQLPDGEIYDIVNANVGTRTLINGTATTVTSGSATKLLEITVPPLSINQYNVSVVFASNATGYRRVIAANSENSSSAINSVCWACGAAANGERTKISLSFSLPNSSSSQGKVYINVVQNSGSSLSCTAYADMVRLK